MISKNGSQLTVALYVDYLKISPVDNSEVTKLIRYLEIMYEKVVLHRGKVHNSLGNLDFTEQSVLQVSIFKYLDKISDEFPEQIGAVSQHSQRIRNQILA